MNWYLLLLCFLSTSADVSCDDVLSRLVNAHLLAACDWGHDGTAFDCTTGSQPKDAVRFSMKVIHPQPSLFRSDSVFGDGRLDLIENHVNFIVNFDNLREKSTIKHACLAMDYCLEGNGSQLKIFKTGQHGQENNVWEAKSSSKIPTICRKLLKTVNINKITPKMETSLNLTIIASIEEAPSAFHLESIKLTMEPCRLRIESDYYREYHEYHSGTDMYFESTTRSLPSETSIQWLNHTIPYFYSNESVETDVIKFKKVSLVTSALKILEEKSCLIFKHIDSNFNQTNSMEINDQTMAKSNFVEITTQFGDHCFTIAKLSNADDDIHTEPHPYHILVNLGKNCWSRRKILHQFMHVLSFGDESNRYDRDFYIRIPWPSLSHAKHDRNSGMAPTWNLPYDYQSVTHVMNFKMTESFNNFNENDDEWKPHDNLSMLDVIRIQRLHCPDEFPESAYDSCPSDSLIIFPSIYNNKCQCITEKLGHPGSCLDIEKQLETVITATSVSYGSILEIGSTKKGITLCRSTGLAVEDPFTCFDTAPELVEFKNEFDYSKQSCSFGYRQVPVSVVSNSHPVITGFQCDAVPTVVQLLMTASSIMVPVSIKNQPYLSHLSNQSFNLVFANNENIYNSSTNLSKNAKIIVRFEVLRALSWIFLGNDNAVNPEAFSNETFFDFSSKFQQPWIDFMDSVSFEKLNDDEMKIFVLIYFNQPVHYDLLWLKKRLNNLLGLDGANRQNGFLFVREKQIQSITDNPCDMLATPQCVKGKLCEASYYFGQLTTCVDAEEKISLQEVSSTDQKNDQTSAISQYHLSEMELVLLIVAGCFGLVIMIIGTLLISSLKKFNPNQSDGNRNENNHQVEMLEISQPPSRDDRRQNDGNSPVSISEVSHRSGIVIASPSASTTRKHFENRAYCENEGVEEVKPVEEISVDTFEAVAF